APAAPVEELARAVRREDEAVVLAAHGDAERMLAGGDVGAEAIARRADDALGDRAGVVEPAVPHGDRRLDARAGRDEVLPGQRRGALAQPGEVARLDGAQAHDDARRRPQPEVRAVEARAAGGHLDAARHGGDVGDAGQRAHLGVEDALEARGGDGEEAQPPAYGTVGVPVEKYDVMNAVQSLIASGFCCATKWPSYPLGAYWNAAAVTFMTFFDTGRDTAGPPKSIITGSVLPRPSVTAFSA